MSRWRSLFSALLIAGLAVSTLSACGEKAEGEGDKTEDTKKDGE